MITKTLHIIFTSLALTVLCIGLMLFTANDAQAASTHDTSHTITTTSVQQNNVFSASKPFNNCAGVKVQHYWWGYEWYLPSCTAALLATGIAFAPGIGPISAAAVSAAIAVSCNGSIYVDEGIPGPTFPRAAC